jgi:hypothetical protein
MHRTGMRCIVMVCRPMASALKQGSFRRLALSAAKPNIGRRNGQAFTIIAASNVGLPSSAPTYEGSAYQMSSTRWTAVPGIRGPSTRVRRSATGIPRARATRWSPCVCCAKPISWLCIFTALPRWGTGREACRTEIRTRRGLCKNLSQRTTSPIYRN